MLRLRSALVLVSLLYLSSMPCRAQQGDRVFSQSYAFDAGDMLSIATSSSDIFIRSGSEGQATVEVFGKGRDAEERFRDLNFTVERDGDALILRTKREGNSWSGNRASYDIVVTAPERLDLNIATSSGDIDFRRIEGEGEIATSSGDIEFDVHVGALSIATSSGDVEADRVQGAFSFVTSSGDFSADAVQGASVEFASSSGDFETDRIDAERFEGMTSSGDISIGTLLGDAEIATSSGDIELGETEGALDITTSSGDVEADLGKPGRVEIATGSGEVSLRARRSLAANVEISGSSIRIDRNFDFDGEIERRSADGRIGGGGTLLKVSTGSGRVSLSSR